LGLIKCHSSKGDFQVGKLLPWNHPELVSVFPRLNPTGTLSELRKKKEDASTSSLESPIGDQ
jgi:hypothetical protein